MIFLCTRIFDLHDTVDVRCLITCVGGGNANVTIDLELGYLDHVT